MKTDGLGGVAAACMRGAGQVMFQESWISGLLFMAGILVGSLGCGGQGHLAVFAGAAVALLLVSALGYAMKLPGREAGLWGFNAVLVGCAAYTFLSVSLPVWLFAGCALLTIPLKALMDKVFRFTSISSLTFPFIVATWILLCVARWMEVAPYQPESIMVIQELTPVSVLVGWLKGLSEIFLIDSWITGLLFLAGLFVAGRQSALWAAIGSALGMGIAALTGCAMGEILLGLWGFSPALTAIAVGVVFKPESSKRSLWPLVTLLAVIVTVLLQMLLVGLLAPAGLPVLTLPFCVATWLVMLIAKYI